MLGFSVVLAATVGIDPNNRGGRALGKLALETFYRRHATDPDFAMVGIVRDDTEYAVRKYVKQTDMRWTIAFDPDGAASLGFATFGQPETYAISPEGMVVGAKIGPSTVEALEAMLARARHIG